MREPIEVNWEKAARLRHVVLALYRVLKPRQQSDHGVAGWFTRELKAHGLDVHRSSVHRWLQGTQKPSARIEERVWSVVGSLHAKAHAEATAHLARVEAITPNPTER